MNDKDHDHLGGSEPVASDEKRIKELENSLSIALENVDKYQRDHNKLKKRVEEAEGENTIIKGIGLNSPEMRALQKEVYDLKKDLAREKEEHQYDNLVHESEMKRAIRRARPV